MNKLIILNLGRGSLRDGFPFINARLETSDKVTQFTGSLPPANELCDLYSRWQLLYNLLYKVRSIGQRKAQFQLIEEDDDDIFIDEVGVTHVSDREFSNLCQQLQDRLDFWLDFEGFRPLERQLRKELNSSDEIRFIIQTEDLEVKKLPWHLWQFCKDYQNTEIAFSSLNFESQKKIINHTHQVRILAILGDSSGIDIQADKQLLEQLPNAEIVFLVEPTRQQLDEQLWDKQGWDILFFAGHSATNIEENCLGQIYVNKTENLTIPQLKNALNKAIANGLQLAIFNSCEGLGLAEQLSDLCIPQIIVMREPVPDKVAQHFLKNFLTLFAEGSSFYLAVREARERLQGIETDFPGASWLPVIFQNPAEIPATWQQLRDKFTSSPLPSYLPSRQPKFSAVIITSITVTALIAGIRWLGILQNWELKAFDSLMQHLPAETADKRILIVGADEEDISRYGYPLSDETLTQLLNKLQSEQAAVIGVDIFRDRPVPENNLKGHQTLMVQFQKSPNAIAVCSGSNLTNSIAPPSQVPRQQIGFVDLYSDKNQTQGKDDTVRRYLLSRSPNPISSPSRCNSSYSFAWQLAYRYLKNKGFTIKSVENNWQFGDVLIKRLEVRSSGYQNLDNKGNQLAIYYRNTPQIAQQVTVRDILDNNNYFNREWIKNRVVLIGVTAPSVPDIHDTVLGEIRGLSVHAHVISQILSAVEDKRPLLWWLPQWGDILWIFFWSFTGAIAIWRWRSWQMQGLGVTIAIAILSGTCWLILTQGGWLPLIPATLAAILSAGSLILVISNQLSVISYQ